MSELIAGIKPGLPITVVRPSFIILLPQNHINHKISAISAAAERDGP